MMGMAMMAAALTPEVMEENRKRAEERKAAIERGEIPAPLHHERQVLDESGFPEVDAEAVRAYLESRNTIIERARQQINSMDAQIEHLEHELALANRKIDALKGAIAKMREEAKAEAAEEPKAE